MIRKCKQTERATLGDAVPHLCPDPADAASFFPAAVGRRATIDARRAAPAPSDTTTTPQAFLVHDYRLQAPKNAVIPDAVAAPLATGRERERNVPRTANVPRGPRSQTCRRVVGSARTSNPACRPHFTSIPRSRRRDARLRLVRSARLALGTRARTGSFSARGLAGRKSIRTRCAPVPARRSG